MTDVSVAPSGPANPGTVVITGGASGLGAAVAAAVRDAGGRPLVIDRADPGEIEWENADLADSESAARAARALVDRAGGEVHGVFTAAGTDSCGRFEDLPAAEWERVVRVNLFGTAAVVRAALPALRRTGGRLVTCASTLGLKALPDATAYCASKFGVVGFTRALAAELAGEVGITLLVPGGMHTAFFDGRPDRYKPAPDARLNKPGDVAATVVFALSQPAGCEIREMVVCPSTETSWP
ncbi:SDR family oxidoreductase [Nocardia sp. BMG51109]|uniref:SDR family oxidoreductase n=1 Tax=Nocardia sp. BMG51109 TaxID=1056816 RepID=UPI000684CA08|nr:SDR family oxidoreductase [Nocardia sp. BMG51109]